METHPSRVGILERLDAIEQIRQLALRDALAVDAKDLEAVGELFIENVAVGQKVGRKELKQRMGAAFGLYRTSISYVSNHLVEVDDVEHAHGVVYARGEYEIEGRWYALSLQYWDKYERQNGRWLFAEQRRHMPWYAVRMGEEPTGPNQVRWPLQPHGPSALPSAWPSWQQFWAERPK